MASSYFSSYTGRVGHLSVVLYDIPQILSSHLLQGSKTLLPAVKTLVPRFESKGICYRVRAILIVNILSAFA